MISINESFESLVEAKGHSLRTNSLALQDLVSKHSKHGTNHIAAELRYRMRLHEPTASASTVNRLVKKALGVHRKLKAAEARKKKAKARKR